MNKVLFALLLVLLSSMAFARGEVVEDRSVSEVEVVESDGTGSTVIANNDVVEKKVKGVEDDRGEVKKVIATERTRTLAEKKKNFGIHMKGSYAMLTGVSLNPEFTLNEVTEVAKWMGTKDYLGVEFAYFFKDKFAIVAGVDAYLLFLAQVGEDGAFATGPYHSPEYCEAFQGGYDYCYDMVGDDHYYWFSSSEGWLRYRGLSLSVAARYYITQFVWGQMGLGVDVPVWGKMYYEGDYYVERVYKKEDLPKHFLQINPAFGVTWPIMGWNIDVALFFSYGLEKVEALMHAGNDVSVGLDMTFWLK